MKKMLLCVLLMTSCSFNTYTLQKYSCENHFTLSSDFRHKYEDNDYFSFISDGYLDVYYDNNKEGNNCHYYLKYKDGTTIDEWGNSVTTSSSITINTKTIKNMSFKFDLYNSPTIDYIIISNLIYGNKEYHLIYVGRYIYSANG